MKETESIEPSSKKEQLAALRGILRQKMHKKLSHDYFPVTLGGLDFEAAIWPVDEGELELAILSGNHDDKEHSRKALVVSEDGEVKETKGEIPKEELTDHEPDFSSISNENIALEVLGKYASFLGISPAQ